MSNLITIRKVTVIAETAIEKTLINDFLKLGAHGYTSIYCFGKGGRHEVMEDPFTGRSLVRIEVLAKPPIAEAILAHVHKQQFENFPLLAFMESVTVYEEDRFF